MLKAIFLRSIMQSLFKKIAKEESIKMRIEGYYGLAEVQLVLKRSFGKKLVNLCLQ